MEVSVPPPDGERSVFGWGKLVHSMIHIQEQLVEEQLMLPIDSIPLPCLKAQGELLESAQVILHRGCKGTVLLNVPLPQRDLQLLLWSHRIKAVAVSALLHYTPQGKHRVLTMFKCILPKV